MNDEHGKGQEDRVLVLAPTSRDSTECLGILNEAGVHCHVCATIEEVSFEAGQGAGAALVTAEALLGDTEGTMAAMFLAQPPWSDLPLIVLTPFGSDSPKLLQALEAIASISFIARPVQDSTLVSAIRVALRDRHRQYEVRDLLNERQQFAGALRRKQTELTDFLENTTVGLHWVGPDGTILWANRAERDMFGYGEEEYVGHNIAEFHADPHVIEDALCRLKNKELIKDLGARMFCKDGTVKHVLIDSSVLWEDDRFVHTRSFTRDITEQKRAEEDRARLAAIVESSDDAIVSKSLDGIIESWNAGAARLFGYAPGEVIGRPITLIIPTERLAEEDAILARLRRGDRIEHFETVRIAKDGRLLNISLTVSPIRDPNGNIIGASKVARDITARKRTERELQDIRSRMEAALGAGAIGTWAWDIPSDRFFADPSLARIFSLPPEDVAGVPLSRIVNAIHPDDRTQVADRVDRAVKNGVRYEADYRVGLPGIWRWVTARGLVERDSDGRAIRFPGVVIDVTERKEAEEALARVTAESDQLRRLYETILSATLDFVYVFSLDYRVLYANDALIDMWGRGHEGSIGKTFLEIGYEPWHAEMHNREIDQVRITRKPIRGEVPFNGTTGRRIYDYIFVPVFGADGQVEAVAGTTRDVTDRQSMEQELRESDRKKDDFIALLAHELRNPLAPIRNGLQLLRLSREDPGVVDRTRAMMDRQLSHMVRLIDDLLDISRINRSKMELRRTRVMLSDVVSSAIETANPVIAAEEHKLTVSLPSAPVYLDADLTRLAQVFSNLLSNSAKYTKRPGHIWLTAEMSGDDIVVTVRDTGIGIPLESLTRIFDMFSQVDRTIERSTGGLGIGLALVKGLVDMHGGTVTAASGGEGKGSTFTVTLPTLKDESNKHPQATDDLGQIAPFPIRRILVVDDNRDGAESLAEMLQLIGNEVHTAHDGLEAVVQAEQFRPAVILMDVGMPRLNGLDATRRIREQPWGKDLTIIALTGWGQEGDRDRSRAAGCDGHLVKPVNLTDLEKLLGELQPLVGVQDNTKRPPSRREVK